ncbi:unnamed protein product, partial [Owenia fusiformis]
VEFLKIIFINIDMIMKWTLCLIAVAFSVAFAEVGVTLKRHSCRRDDYLFWGGERDNFFTKCAKGEMVVVTNAVLYPVEHNLTCVMNNSECRHNFTQSAFDTCVNTEVCLPMVNYIESKRSCCKNLLCHEIEYECVPGSCKLPSSPANGQIYVSEDSGIWNGSVSYSCNRDFTLAGEQTRTCIRKEFKNGPWSSAVEYRYTWSGNQPVCDVDETLCPSTAFKKETLGLMCYEFHDDQRTTFQNAKEACESRRWKLATVINEETLRLIRHHM